MKKTIAILLVLVIGMVGVFAADPVTKDIVLTTEITPVSSILITTAKYDTYTKANYDSAVSDSNSRVSAGTNSIVVNNSGAISNVGYLSIFSNLAAGFTVDYKATAMVSVTGATARYINYEVQIGDDATTKITTADDSEKSADITEMATQDNAVVFSEKINITIAEDFHTALAGDDDYVGTITFSFTAG